MTLFEAKKKFEELEQEMRHFIPLFTDQEISDISEMSIPELDATHPAGEHVGIIVWSPLKIFNRNIGWVCFCAIQVKPTLEISLFCTGPSEISLEKTKLNGVVYVVGGQTTFIQNDLP